MIADEQPQYPFVGTPDATLLDADAFHEAIVSFIGQQLPVWRNKTARPPFQDEPRLNQSLCLHLNRAARHSFDSIEFTQEPIQSGSRRGDIGVMEEGMIAVDGRDYYDWVQLLPIECKRLPTPPDKKRSDCEYVHGTPGHRTGAIERFKHRLHGPSNRRAMIIGYVQSESLDHWLETINARLAKLAKEAVDDGLWDPAEFLTKAGMMNLEDLQRFQSSHRRNDSSEVSIRHLWVSMN